MIIKLRAFTIIELIIGISIIVLLTAIALPRLNNFKDNQNHKNEVNNVLSILNEARVSALSGDSSRAYSVSIDTDLNTFNLFRVTIDESDIPYSETITLNDKITITTNLNGEPSNVITFDRFTGATNNTGTITITTNSGTYSKSSIIQIYKTGLASLD